MMEKVVVGANSTTGIGNEAVRQNEIALGPDGEISGTQVRSDREFRSAMIVMPMDMEYAHINGYYGKRIYNDDETPWYYYVRSTGLGDGDGAKKIPVFSESAETFSTWEEQVEDILAAVAQNPWKLIPMYHYEPRRWCREKGAPVAHDMSHGPWDKPFCRVATQENLGVFLGFKMYPPLGYSPLDPKLSHLREFYRKCERESIPILAHCSPGGMMTHEACLYLEHLSDPSSSDDREAASYRRNHAINTDGSSGDGFDEKAALDFFKKEFVHPQAWKPVLEKFPSLKLCLAHFGGDEWQKGIDSDWIAQILDYAAFFDNFYTDISCFALSKNLDNFEILLSDDRFDHIKDKILFGSDWYMTLLATGLTNYKEFCKTLKKFLDRIDTGLWLRFTMMNPLKYFGFDNRKKLENLAKGMNALPEIDLNEVDNGLSFFKNFCTT